MPKIINLEEMRQSLGIGASEVAAVCHLDPWATARELWEIKTGRRAKAPRTAAMEFGIEMEPNGLAHYLHLTGRDLGNIIIETQVCAVHSKFPYLRAIADGWNGTTGVQIKCPSGDNLLESMRRGLIPKHYLVQCAAEMAIFEAEGWDFFVYDAEKPEESKLIQVNWAMPFGTYYDLQTMWIEIALPLIEEFWKRLCAEKWEDSERDIPPSVTWENAIKRRQDAEAKILELQEIKDFATAELQQMMGFNSKASNSGWLAYWQRRKPAYKLTISCDDAASLAEVKAAIEPLENAEGVRKIEAKESSEAWTFQVKGVKGEK